MDQHSTPAMPAELAAALVAAQAAANPVGKDATHAHHKYKYVAADTMIAEGRAALAAAGVALFSSGWRFDPLGSDGSAIGRVVVSYLLVHKSGAAHAFDSSSFVITEKGRPADKAEMGAITENLSYTIRGLLLLPRVDEAVSVERRDDRSFEPQRQASTPASSGPVDPAHDALAADFKRRLADLGDLSLFGDFVRDLDAASLPQALLDDVRAEIVVAGVRFAVEQEDLEAWVPKLQGWKLSGAARDRAAAAWEKRSDELAAQRPAAAE